MQSMTKEPMACLYGPRKFAIQKDVVFLQECNVTNTIWMPPTPQNPQASGPYTGRHKPWADLLQRQGITDHENSRALITKHCGIIINNPAWKILDQEYIPDSKRVRVEVELPEPLWQDDPQAQDDPQSRRLTLFSIHSRSESLWVNNEAGLSRYMPSPTSTSRVIIGADFNSWASRTLDNTKGYGPSIAWSAIRPTLQVLDLVDGYRSLHPLGRDVTHRMPGSTDINGRKVEPSGRRIDAIWIPSQAASRIREARSYSTSRSDHRLVLLTVGGDNEPASSHGQLHGPGKWRLHEGLWRSDVVARATVECTDAWVRQPFSSWGEWLEAKAQLRDVLYETSRPLGVEAQGLAGQAESFRTRLDNLEMHTDARRQLQSLHEGLRSAEAAQRHQDSMRRRSDKRAHALFRYNREGPDKVPPLQQPAPLGLTTSRPQQLTCVNQHFARLLHILQSELPAEEAALFAEAVAADRLEGRRGSDLGRVFTVKQWRDSLRQSKPASVGIDGLPYSVYDAMPDKAVEKILGAVNSLLDGKPMPTGEPALRGTIFCKVKDAEGRQDLNNWRGVTIPTAEHRIMTRMIRTRLQEVIAFLCPSPLQNGFILKRGTKKVVVNLYLLQERHRLDPASGPTVIASLDQTKAYDKVRREFLFYIMEKGGVSDKLITFLRTFFAHPTITYYVEGWATQPVTMKCGLPQGDPVSPLLFNIYLQPLLSAVSRCIGTELPIHNKPPVRVSALAFADDYMFCFKPSTDATTTGVSETRTYLEAYCKAANAELNKNKSFVTVLSGEPLAPDGPHADAVAATCKEIEEKIGVKVKQQREIKPLGHPFVVGELAVPREGYDERIAAIQNRIAFLDPTTKGDLFLRADFVNSSLLTKLWHALSLCPLPLGIEQRVMHAVAAFVFLGRKNWVPWVKIALLPRRLGGLGIISTEDMLMASTIAMAGPLLTGDDPTSKAFQQGFHDWILSRDASPALFFCRHGKAWYRMANRFVAQSSFFGRVAWALSRAPLTLSEDWAAYTLLEILGCPWYYAYCGPLPPVGKTAIAHQLLSRMWLIADIVWFNNAFNVTYPEHPQRYRPDATIVPVTAYAIHRNYRQTPHRLPKGHPHLIRACGWLKTHWLRWWEALPAPWRVKLEEELPERFPPLPDLATGRHRPRPHSRPHDLHPSDYGVPWRHVLFNGRPIGTIPTKFARQTYGPTEAAKPKDWDLLFSSTLAEWTSLWGRFDDLRLHSDIRASNFLFQHCRAWRASQPPLTGGSPEGEVEESSYKAWYQAQLRRNADAEVVGDAPQVVSSSDDAEKEVVAEGEEEEVMDGEEGEAAVAGEGKGKGKGKARAKGEGEAVYEHGDESEDESEDEDEDEVTDEVAKARKRAEAKARKKAEAKAQREAALLAAQMEEEEEQRKLDLEEQEAKALNADLDADNGDDETPPPYHVLPCPFCKGPKDDVPHGYRRCEKVQELWEACEPLLQAALGKAPAPKVNTRDIVLGWPDYQPTRDGRIAPRHLARLFLWRCCVVHEIAQYRHHAFADSRRTGKQPTFDRVTPQSFANAVRKTFIRAILDSLPTSTSRFKMMNYIKKWINGGKVLEATTTVDRPVIDVLAP